MSPGAAVSQWQMEVGGSHPCFLTSQVGKSRDMFHIVSYTSPVRISPQIPTTGASLSPYPESSSFLFLSPLHSPTGAFWIPFPAKPTALKSLTQSLLLRVCSLRQDISLCTFFFPSPHWLASHLHYVARWLLDLDEMPQGRAWAVFSQWPQQCWMTHPGSVGKLILHGVNLDHRRKTDKHMSPTFPFLGFLPRVASLCKLSGEILCAEKACLPRDLLCFFGALLNSCMVDNSFISLCLTSQFFPNPNDPVFALPKKSLSTVILASGSAFQRPGAKAWYWFKYL